MPYPGLPGCGSPSGHSCSGSGSTGASGSGAAPGERARKLEEELGEIDAGLRGAGQEQARAQGEGGRAEPPHRPRCLRKVLNQGPT